MHQTLTPTQIAGIKEYCTTHRDEIAAVYLYGSMAEGVADVLSDIDLAVLLHEPLKRDAFDIECDATTAFQKLFEREVDVRALTGKTSLPFLEEVLRDHILIAASDDDARAEFESRTIQRIIDFRPALTQYLSAMMDRLQKGTYASQY